MCAVPDHEHEHLGPALALAHDPALCREVDDVGECRDSLELAVAKPSEQGDRAKQFDLLVAGHAGASVRSLPWCLAWAAA